MTAFDFALVLWVHGIASGVWLSIGFVPWRLR